MSFGKQANGIQVLLNLAMDDFQHAFSMSLDGGEVSLCYGIDFQRLFSRPCRRLDPIDKERH